MSALGAVAYEEMDDLTLADLARRGAAAAARVVVTRNQQRHSAGRLAADHPRRDTP
jgi:hypothetical protein